MKLRKLLPLVMLVNCSVAFAAEGDLYIYPSKNQDEAQQERDRYECFVWANRETGFNPNTAENVSESKIVRVPVGQNPNANAVGVGAILGAIVGVAIGDSSRAAVIGAGVGTATGAVIQSEGRRQVEAEAREKGERMLAENKELLQQAQAYRRAFSACLEGRGYIVR